MYKFVPEQYPHRLCRITARFTHNKVRWYLSWSNVALKASRSSSLKLISPLRYTLAIIGMFQLLKTAAL
jgi:hypothetical protein